MYDPDFDEEEVETCDCDDECECDYSDFDDDCDFDDDGAFGSAGWGTDEYYDHGG